LAKTASPKERRWVKNKVGYFLLYGGVGNVDFIKTKKEDKNDKKYHR
jgi:hypothetical protein